ncbi:hypothetical protein ACISUF_15460, partial [Streptomyces sp. NPDC003090]
MPSGLRRAQPPVAGRERGGLRLPAGVTGVRSDRSTACVRGCDSVVRMLGACVPATASRQDPPCTTPDELAKAVAAMPRIRPPEP